MGIVHYPVRVTGYRMVAGTDFVSLELEGVEPRLEDATARPELAEPVGDVTFKAGAAPAIWFDRRGAVHLTRPLELAAPVAGLLRDESAVYLNGDGSFMTELPSDS